MLTGETVGIKSKVTAYDSDGNKTETWDTTATVGDVLVAPGDTSDIRDGDRTDSTKVSFTLGFPKTFSTRLRGCRCTVRGTDYSVIGDPQPNTLANCPTAWWYTARVEAIDG